MAGQVIGRRQVRQEKPEQIPPFQHPCAVASRRILSPINTFFNPFPCPLHTLEHRMSNGEKTKRIKSILPTSRRSAQSGQAHTCRLSQTRYQARIICAQIFTLNPILCPRKTLRQECGCMEVRGVQELQSTLIP